MNTHSVRTRIRLAIAATLLGALAACGQQAPAETSQPPASTSDTPSAPATPAPEAPAEPAPVSEPTAESSPTLAANSPALESMQSAKAPTKLSVPVDLRYSFDAAPEANRPVTLHLAAVPRVAGTNLNVSVKAVEGIQVAAGGALSAQKASANGTYRQQFSVTRQATAPAELRVLVTMDLPQGSAFGYFSIPLESGPKSQKQLSVKQP